MGKNLVIVESPAKAKTLEKYLGKDYVVRASVGHIRDLPKSKLGVDLEQDFEPKYVVISGKAKVVKDLKDAAAGKDMVLLAPDPDREGEAIAWHLAELLQNGTGAVKVPIKRVLFEEITKPAVLESIKNPRDLNKDMFESQQARRILDRLVGYKVSPLLWDKVRRGLSAGRVQTVALWIICQREKEIKAFVPLEYWSIIADLKAKLPPAFTAYLYSFDGERVGKEHKNISNQEEASKLVADLEKADYVVKEIKRKERKRKPVPPFITSKLQQEASVKLGYQPRRTMAIAQQLYEGIDVGEGEGPVGLITYMRTDATRVSPIAIEEVRGYIDQRYGENFLPKSPNEFKSKKNAQEAHEAIRPTSVLREPDAIKKKLTAEQFKLYDLIWKRFVASQMTSAVFDQTTVDIEAGKGIFRATGQILKFEGFIKVYMEGQEDTGSEDGDGVEASGSSTKGKVEDKRLPELKEGEKLELTKITPNQHFTSPPPRFTQASLIKELEENGIGRPSTYASIMSTILNREYVELDQSKRMFPTELGILVADLLVEAFPKEFDVSFTASMESQLDEISEGKLNWVKMMKEFYGHFSDQLEHAAKTMRDVKTEAIKTDLKCPDCGGELTIRWGRRGEFLACSKYPDCKFTSDFERAADGTVSIVEAQRPEVTDVPCPKCGKPTIIRSGRFGPFRGCSGYPECKFIESIKGKNTIGLKCPKCEKGDVLEKRSRWGKVFYGCSEYSRKGDGCDFVCSHKPVSKPCPTCGANFLMIKPKKGENFLVCANKECDHTESYFEEQESAGEEGTENNN